jgi:hypothetical protein
MSASLTAIISATFMIRTSRRDVPSCGEATSHLAAGQPVGVPWPKPWGFSHRAQAVFAPALTIFANMALILGDLASSRLEIDRAPDRCVIGFIR